MTIEIEYFYDGFEPITIDLIPILLKKGFKQDEIDENVKKGALYNKENNDFIFIA